MDFLDKVVVTQLIKKNLDETLYRFFEYAIGININKFAIPKKTIIWAKSSENKYKS